MLKYLSDELREQRARLLARAAPRVLDTHGTSMDQNLREISHRPRKPMLADFASPPRTPRGLFPDVNNDQGEVSGGEGGWLRQPLRG